jgi:chromosome segregation ATPase
MFDTDENDNLYVNKNLNNMLNERLKTSFSGYSKSSVVQLIEELSNSSEQMKFSLEKQIQDLLNEKSALSQECILLRNQLSEVEKKQAYQKKDLDNFLYENKEKTSNIEKELSRLKEENDILNMELSRRGSQENLHSLEKKLAGKEKEIIDKDSKISELHERLSENTKEIKVLKEQINILNQNNISESSGYESREQEEFIQKLTVELEALQSQLSEETEKFKKQEKTFINRISSECERADKAEKNIIEVLEKHEFSQERLKQEQERVNELEKQWQKQNKEHGELKGKYNELHESYTSAVQKNNSLYAEKQAISDLLKKYQKKEQEYALIQKQNEEYRETIMYFDEGIKMILQEMEEQMKLFKSTVEQYHDGEILIHGLVQEKTRLQIKNVDLLNQISILTSNLVKAEQESEKLNKMVCFSKNKMQYSDAGSSEVNNSDDDIDVLELKITDKDENDGFVNNAVQRAKEISKIYSIDKKSESTG